MNQSRERKSIAYKLICPYEHVHMILCNPISNYARAIGGCNLQDIIIYMM
jgi:hypothetical protein